MGADEQYIRESFAEVHKTLAEINKAIADLRVVVAGEYVRSEDFKDCQRCSEDRVVALHKKIEDHEKTERAERWKVVGVTLTISAFVFSIIQWLWEVRGGGQ